MLNCFGIPFEVIDAPVLVRSPCCFGATSPASQNLVKTMKNPMHFLWFQLLLDFCVHRLNSSHCFEHLSQHLFSDPHLSQHFLGKYAAFLKKRCFDHPCFLHSMPLYSFDATLSFFSFLELGCLAHLKAHAKARVLGRRGVRLGKRGGSALL